jgi:exopolyphosphatase / guanosine-5'-triphosphate,3'-diphosphate pyrophosphatase
MNFQSAESERFLAAIDVGTNSIHMVIVQIQPSLPAFAIVAREKDTVRLGERCQQTGQLTPAAMERAIAALRRCQGIAKSFDAEEVIAVATSAVREAPNGREFLQRVEAELGLAVNLISGQEEARRIYLGVLSGMEFNHHPHVIVDIGGGSTELILGNGHEPRYLSSTKVGAVRLTERLITTDPLSELEFERLRAYVRGMLERPLEELRSHLKPGEALQLVGTSGTIESLAALHACQKLGTAPSPLNGYEMSAKDLQELLKQLRKMTCDSRRAMPGMSERRAEIIVAGASILLEVISELGVESIKICERALREGMIVNWMLTHGLIEDRLRYQSSVRQRSVFSLARKFGVDLEHSKRVAAFVLSLFDQLRGQLHTWGDPERELLWAAAMLHNAGHYVSHAAHHKHSYYLVRNADLLGYTEAEIETIANLVRYHRKSPPKKKHDNYRNLPTKQHRQIVDQLHPLLRLAVALDRRRVGAIAGIRCDYDDPAKTLALHLEAANPEDSCELELWSLDFKKDCFETVYGVQLLPKLVSPQPATAIA